MSERAIRFQNGCFEHRPQSDTQKEEEKQHVYVLEHLDRFLRYQTAHDRAYARAAAELAKRRKERAAQERGFVSQRRAEKAEKQRDEIHELKKTNLQLTIELKQIRILEKIDLASEPPKAKRAA